MKKLILVLLLSLGSNLFSFDESFGHAGKKLKDGSDFDTLKEEFLEN